MEADMKRLTLFSLFLSLSAALFALETSPLFSSGMVLQRNQTNPIWGDAVPGETVSVELAGEQTLAVADEMGRWEAQLPSLPAGGPHRMTIRSGDETLEYEDVLVGEVWLCGGQSNMHWNISQFSTPEKWLEESRQFPQMRLLTVERKGAVEPQSDVTLSRPWSRCNPDEVKNFSATAYHFGKRIQKELGIPVGLISANFSASAAECWVPRKVLDANSGTATLYSDFERLYGGLPASAPGYKWVSGLYNGMISPIAGYGIKGVIWYQGESNIDKPLQYKEIMRLMLESWKKDWEMESLPFFYVQIAHFNYGRKRNFNSFRLMESQQALEKLIPDSQMIITSDIGDWNDIHPANKHDVGSRLAAAALDSVYDLEVPSRGPEFVKAVVEGEALRLYFDHAQGLELRGGHGFQLAGKNGRFRPAEAEVEGETLRVTSSRIKNPKYVRFGWSRDLPLELYNGDALPCAPFRNDQLER